MMNESPFKLFIRRFVHFSFGQVLLIIRSFFVSPIIALYIIFGFVLIAFIVEPFGIHFDRNQILKVLFHKEITRENLIKIYTALVGFIFLGSDIIKYFFKIEIQWTTKKFFTFFYVIPIIMYVLLMLFDSQYQFSVSNLSFAVIFLFFYSFFVMPCIMPKQTFGKIKNFMKKYQKKS